MSWRHPDGHPWRDDRLGRDLRRGLAPQRQAEPDAAVWRRIAREIEPPRQRGLSRWLGALATGRHESGFGARLGGAQRPAVLLGAMAMAFVLAIGNLLGSGGLQLGGCIGRPDCSWDQLSGAELSIQRQPLAGAIEEQPGWLFRVAYRHRIDREARLERLMAGREAYNRSDWLHQPLEPARGPATTAPVTQVALH